MGIKKYIVTFAMLFAMTFSAIADPGPRLVYQVQAPGLSGISTVEPIFDLSGNITSFVTSGSKGSWWLKNANPFIYLIDTLGSVTDSLSASSDSILYFSDFQSVPSSHIGSRARVFVTYLATNRSAYLYVKEIEFGLISSVNEVYKVDKDDVSAGWTYYTRVGTGRDDIQLS